MPLLLHNALRKHGVGNLQEAGNVCADNKVSGLTALNGGVVCVVEDILHDGFQTGIHFLKGPAQTHGVLGHFQTAGGDTARVGRLAGAEEQTCGHGAPA